MKSVNVDTDPYRLLELPAAVNIKNMKNVSHPVYGKENHDKLVDGIKKIFNIDK
jgi:hypothetical protein